MARCRTAPSCGARRLSDGVRMRWGGGAPGAGGQHVVRHDVERREDEPAVHERVDCDAQGHKDGGGGHRQPDKADRLATHKHHVEAERNPQCPRERPRHHGARGDGEHDRRVPAPQPASSRHHGEQHCGGADTARSAGAGGQGDGAAHLGSSATDAWNMPGVTARKKAVSAATLGLQRSVNARQAHHRRRPIHTRTVAPWPSQSPERPHTPRTRPRWPRAPQRIPSPAHPSP